jgi:hypothetical protein
VDEPAGAPRGASRLLELNGPGLLWEETQPREVFPATWYLALVPAQKPDDLLADAVGVRAEVDQHLCRDALTLADVTEQDVFGTDVVVAQLRAAQPAPQPAPAAFPHPSPLRPPAGAVYYANCTAVRAAGVAPIMRGGPGYSSKLDRDGDGIACE